MFGEAKASPYIHPIIIKAMNIKELKSNFSIYGNKGDVWSNTAHIYKSLTGVLCGKPALATNHVRLNGVEEIGCTECIKKYLAEQK